MLDSTCLMSCLLRPPGFCTSSIFLYTMQEGRSAEFSLCAYTLLSVFSKFLTPHLAPYLWQKPLPPLHFHHCRQCFLDQADCYCFPPFCYNVLPSPTPCTQLPPSPPSKNNETREKASQWLQSSPGHHRLLSNPLSRLPPSPNPPVGPPPLYPPDPLPPLFPLYPANPKSSKSPSSVHPHSPGESQRINE